VVHLLLAYQDHHQEWLDLQWDPPMVRRDMVHKDMAHKDMAISFQDITLEDLHQDKVCHLCMVHHLVMWDQAQLVLHMDTQDHHI